MGDPLTIVTGTLGLLGLNESRKSRRDARRARRIDERRGRLQASRSAIDQVRQAQIARASVIQQGENQGVSGSSAVQGGAGSIQSQAGGNIAFAQQVFDLQNSANRLRLSSQLHSSKSASFSQLATVSANTDFANMFSNRTDGGAPVSTATPS